MGRKDGLNWLLLGYLAITVIVLIARWALPETSWASWLIDHYLLVLFVPLPLLFLICLISRSWKSLAFLMIPLLAFLSLYGRLFIPNLRPDSSPLATPLRVMTFNVLFSNPDQAAVAKVIKDSGAALVGVQELTRSNAPSLAGLLQDSYPYHTPLPEDRTPQVALFSRYPILEAQRLNLPLSDRSWGAIVDIGNAHIKVIVLHLTATRAAEVPISQWPNRITERQVVRLAQLDKVIDAALASRWPVLVLCDCNFTEVSDAYAQLDEHLDDSFAEVGWGLGHTIHPPNIDLRYQRIDYVWHSPDFISISARVLKDGKSDHNPLAVDFILVPP
jgi:endonuclease/exonuclease/phosphatase (EEP) superfamily protein YafD